MTWVDAIWYERTEASNERIDKIFTLALAATERRECAKKSIPMLRSYFNVNRQHVWYANSRTFKCSAYRSASYRTPLRANGGKRRKLYENTLLLFSSRNLSPIKPAYAKHFRWGIISFYRPFYDREREREREIEIAVDNTEVASVMMNRYGKIAYWCGEFDVRTIVSKLQSHIYNCTL